MLSVRGGTTVTIFWLVFYSIWLSGGLDDILGYALNVTSNDIGNVTSAETEKLDAITKQVNNTVVAISTPASSKIPETTALPTTPQDSNGEFLPFRLRLFFTKRARASLSSLADGSFLEGMLEEVRMYYGSLLQVQREEERLYLTRRSPGSSCDLYKEFRHHYFPQFHNENPAQRAQMLAETGLDCDCAVYILVINDTEENCNDDTLATAKPCENFRSGRPKYGTMVLCIRNLRIAKWNQYSLYSTLRHELVHIFGMYGSNLKLAYRTLTVTRKWKIHSNLTIEKNVTLVNTTKVKEFVRWHFNCSDLEGAELEDGGGTGTASSHWEKRIFGPEAMTGMISRRTYMSNLTLGFLEDTSWYKVNYSMAEPLTYGKFAGCIFAQKSCREYMDSMPDQERAAVPYCNWADYIDRKRQNSVFRRCTVDRISVAHCDFVNASISSYQYFFDKAQVVDGKFIVGTNVLGRMELNDHCPVWTDTYYGDHGAGKRIGDSVCIHPDSQPPASANFGAELHGGNSICVEHDGKFEIIRCAMLGFAEYNTEKSHGASCYQYKCARGRLMILANFSDHPDDGFMRAFKVCWGAGMKILIRRHQFTGEGYLSQFHKGDLVCPPCAEICEGNSRFPGFKCAKDVKINSRDFTRKACSVYSTASNVAINCLTLLYALQPILTLIYLCLMP